MALQKVRLLKMSKELFFNMRAEDLALMYSDDFSKRDAELTGQKLVKTILDAGNVDAKKVFSNIVRLKAVIDSADKAFRDELEFISKENFNGVEFNPTAPRGILNYEGDAIYRDLVRQIKAREVLLKEAFHSKNDVPDLNGEVVPKVSSKFTKSSITIKF